MFPDYLTVASADLGKGTNVRVTTKGDMASIAQAMAEDMRDEILQAQRKGRHATLIVPVGPVDHYPILAQLVNKERISLQEVVFINMDEYLTNDDQWIPTEHPFSFRGHMNRLFYNLIDPDLAPKGPNCVFPHPERCGEIPALIENRGGVDCTFGGIGINGHVAFNEPPEPGDTISDEAFARLPTRVLSVARETRTVNSVTVGGDISLIPWRCVTVGMEEILGSKRLRFYCNRPWQSAVARRALHGPITAKFPASFMRAHPEAYLTVADYVAEPPQLVLR